MPLRTKPIAGLSLLALLLLGGAAVVVPPVRQRAEHLAAHAYSRLARRTAAVKPLAKPIDLGMAGAPGVTTFLDERLSPVAASEIATLLSAVDPAGFIALSPSIEAKGVTADASLERAALPPSRDAGSTSVPAASADFANAHQAIAFYRKGTLDSGDSYAQIISDPVLRTALEWVAVRFNPREIGLDRLRRFANSHPDWPTMPWVNRRIEEATLDGARDPVSIRARFADTKPKTYVGRLALARADLASGDTVAAKALIAAIWRLDDLTASEEASVLKEFGGLIGRDDHKYRADRLLYKEQVGPALRVAMLAGPDVRLLALARASVINQAGTAVSDAAIAAVPASLAGDPGLTFSRIQKARRAGRVQDAATLMTAAPRDPAALINGDEWWVERRLIARKLLDAGDAKTAYTLCANHAAFSDASTIEAEFHAGWIALRFLNDAKTAALHFARAASSAETPISRSRAAYWQGRAAEAASDAATAKGFYETASAQSISFYGQLASSRLGRTTLDLRQPAAVAQAEDRREAIRVVELLYALGERDIALPLAFEIAKSETSDTQVASLAAVLTKAADARGTLLVGKYATQRGMALDETAFPTFGIPDYQPLTNSADRAVVYAIARQESEFDPRSVSSAGAKGLMQLITPTARSTAQKFGVAFDDGKLINDASFNARIGAAHLGQLLAEQGGSYILTFAAYNAGSSRVKDWIAAYGDPRKPGVDPVDWIERIPFTETRNYVQRVFENLQVYRRRFGQSDKLLMVGTEGGLFDKRT